MTNDIVRHILICRFKPTTTNEQLNTLCTTFNDLTRKIEGIISFEMGANNSPEKLHHGMTHIIMVTFVNAQARDAYLPHPEHRKFADWFTGMGILDELVVVDYTPMSV